MANPPFNISEWWDAKLEGDPRWRYGTPPRGNTNFAWIQHMLHHLASGSTSPAPTARANLSMNKDVFLALLPTLGFTSRGGLWTKSFDAPVRLVVDLANETLSYPQDLKVNDTTTCNFSANENFVVFECVHRLSPRLCLAPPRTRTALAARPRRQRRQSRHPRPRQRRQAAPLLLSARPTAANSPTPGTTPATMAASSSATSRRSATPSSSASTPRGSRPAPPAIPRTS